MAKQDFFAKLNQKVASKPGVVAVQGTKTATCVADKQSQFEDFMSVFGAANATGVREGLIDERQKKIQYSHEFFYDFCEGDKVKYQEGLDHPENIPGLNADMLLSVTDVLTTPTFTIQNNYSENEMRRIEISNPSITISVYVSKDTLKVQTNNVDEMIRILGIDIRHPEQYNGAWTFVPPRKLTDRYDFSQSTLPVGVNPVTSIPGADSGDLSV